MYIIHVHFLRESGGLAVSTCGDCVETVGRYEAGTRDSSFEECSCRFPGWERRSHSSSISWRAKTTLRTMSPSSTWRTKLEGRMDVSETSRTAGRASAGLQSRPSISQRL